MLRINEAAKRLGVTPGTLRRWEEEGLIHPDRTAGGERRFHEGELDQLAARVAEGGGARRQKRRPISARPTVAEAEEEADRSDDYSPNPDRFPSAQEALSPWERRVQEARADLEVRKLKREAAELDRAEREAVEARARQQRETASRAQEDGLNRKAEAEEAARLQKLREHGDLLASIAGAPIEYKAAVTRDLQSYVNREQFPYSLQSGRANEYLQVRVDQVLKPWRDIAEKEREEQQRRQHLSNLLQSGNTRAFLRTLHWPSQKGRSARRDVEDTLKDEVTGDWTEGEVTDLVQGILDEYE
jgi:excisionase family DNA binding protein